MRPRPDGAGVGIAVGLEELGEPDGRVDGQDAALEGFDGDAPADGEEEAPEALDSHDGWLCSDGDLATYLARVRRRRLACPLDENEHDCRRPIADCRAGGEPRILLTMIIVI